MTNPIVAYYKRRAPEYDAVFARPERQADLAMLRERLRTILRGRRVLEVAAGTGFWTEAIADVAERVCATDISAEPLKIAGQRDYGNARVEFQIADAFDLVSVPGRYDALLAGFFWSHINRTQIRDFLAGLSGRLDTGAVVVAMDNRYVAGNSTPIARTDEAGNTFQARKLSDGSDWEVLKNFPSEAELIAAIGPFASELEVELLTYYWLASFVIR